MSCCGKVPAAAVTSSRAWSRFLRVTHENLERRYAAAGAEENLRGVQRHEDKIIVIFKHADIEHGRDFIAAHTRRGAEDRGFADGGNQRQGIAHMQIEPLRHANADSDIGAAIIFQRAISYVIGDCRALKDCFLRQAAHESAGGGAFAGDERLRFDRRLYGGNVGDFTDCVEERLIILQRSLHWIEVHMPVEADDALKQFLAEAVHHRHDDDQSRDAERDADQREPGDDRNKPLLPPRAEVTHSYKAFEGGEHQ
jgi:hypothetical protein